MRNLEVNTLKRIVGLTSCHRDLFSNGLDLKEHLLLVESSFLNNKKPLPYVDEVLENRNDLAYLISTYYKPLIIQNPGHASKSGAALWALANVCGAHTQSSFDFDFASAGQAPSFGASATLLKAPAGFAEMLLLTGSSVAGPMIYHLNICNRWLARDAFQVMEVTSENHLRVSEYTSRTFVDEHALNSPPMPQELINLKLKVNEWFDSSSHKSVADVIKKLKSVVESSDAHLLPEIRQVAEQSLSAISSRSPVILEITFQIVRSLREYKRYLIRNLLQVPIETFSKWEDSFKLNTQHAFGSDSDAEAQIVQQVQRLLLVKALTFESRASKYLMTCQDGLEATAQSLLAGTEFEIAPHSIEWSNGSIQAQDLHLLQHVIHNGPPPQYEFISEIASSDSSEGVTEGFESVKREMIVPVSGQVLDACRFAEFKPRERTELPLSIHPKLRTQHPDYDKSTGLDYDPSLMKRELKRWHPDSKFLQVELYRTKQLLTDSKLLRERAKKSFERMKAEKNHEQK